MYLKFTKNYLTTEKGRVLILPEPHGNKLIKDKIAEEIDEKEYSKQVESTNKKFENTTQPTKEEHLAKLGKMSLQELQDYCKENKVTIEVEEGATVEDVVTLIDIAEEGKKKGGQ